MSKESTNKENANEISKIMDKINEISNKKSNLNQELIDLIKKLKTLL